MLRERTALPDPATDQHVRRRRRRTRSISRSARAAIFLRRLRRWHDPPGQLHGREPAADRGGDRDPDRRRRSADGQLRRHRLQRPRPRRHAHLRLGPRRRRAFDDSTSPSRRHTYTSRWHLHASLESPTTTARASTASVTINVGNTPPTATITSPAPGTTWKVGDVIQFAGRRDRRAGRPPAGVGALLEPDPASLPVQLPPASAPDVRRRRRAARSRRPTTSIRPIWSCG